MFPKRRSAVESAEPEPAAPRRFRVLDVMTRELLADDVAAREAVDALRDVRSVVDVNVYVWHQEHERWRRLTLDEQRAMLDLAHADAAGTEHLPPSPPPQPPSHQTADDFC